jgi:RHS repeat-associated protein
VATVTPANQLYCYHFNAIGSTIAVTDQTQAMVNKYAYDPFGNIANQVEAVTQPFKFVGQFGVMTEPNGFYCMRARYYDPEVGRFISEDPIGFDGGDVNLYAYVQNNPILIIDPNGEWGQIVAGAIYGGISGFTAGAIKGNIWAGIAGGVAGGVVGAAVGTVMPAASGYIGSMVGGAISGMIGGAVAGGVASGISGTSITKGVVIGGAVGLGSGALAGPVGYMVKQGVGVAIASQSPNLVSTISAIAQNNVSYVAKTSAITGMAAIGK